MQFSICSAILIVALVKYNPTSCVSGGVFGYEEKVKKPVSLEKVQAASPLRSPPILEGEDARAYHEILDRVFGAVRPTDFIEEIWVRDLVDVTWSMFRLRRLQATFWSDKVSHIADDRASSRATAEAELVKGPIKEEMDRLLDSDPGLSWETACEQNPRANEKFQELYSSAWSSLDLNSIQEEVMFSNFHRIEPIVNLIVIAQRRFDEVIRELDRHRFMQKQLHSFQDRQGSKLESVEPKMIEGKTTNEKAA